MALLKKYSLLFSALACALILGVFGILTNQLSSRQLDEQETALHDSIERCIMACYALEGFFPPDLEYMQQHYGLTYNEDAFFIDYQPVAANLRPDYFVLRIRKED